MSAKTLDRCLETLRRVASLAKGHDASVVFLGDFWDARGVLSVRQVDAVMTEFDAWESQGIEAVFIPGNHDQVSTDGGIHGVRMFEKYANFQVATEPVIDERRKVAFLPWRQDGQDALVEALPGTGWLIFGHFEVQGALSNTQHRAVGRIGLATIESKARACYCGHYHKRQKLGSRTWYVGNSYEKDFGEMGDPKGVAIVDLETAMPQFFDFVDLPKHKRLSLGDAVTDIREHDIVEFRVPRAALSERAEEVRAYLAKIPATDIRTKPIREEDGTTDAEAEHVMSLETAIGIYVAENPGVDGVSSYELASFGAGLLKEVPEAGTAPMHPVVTVKSVTAKDFCAIRGKVTLDLDQKGLLLLRGPIGVGKTAVVDSISWCLFGQTAPRKAGSSSASFRGDEVVHDDAEEASVTVTLGTPDGDVTVVRKKKRGAGATIKIDGVDAPAGITDTGDIVRRAVGLDYALWRSCVNLGQGAVGSFVTDADTKRKALLSDALGLGACDLAQDIAKQRLSPAKSALGSLQGQHVAETHAIEVLKQQNFDKQIEIWEAQRTAAMAVAEEDGQRAKAAVASTEALLAGEQGWLETRDRLRAAVEGLAKSLVAGPDAKRASDLERSLGSIDAESRIVERELALKKAEYTKLEAGGGDIPCPSCGRPLDATDGETRLTALRNEITGLEHSLRSFGSARQNVEFELATHRANAHNAAADTKKQMTAHNEDLEKCASAIAQFAKIRANKEEAARALERARAVWQEKKNAKNPFAEQREEHAKHVAMREAMLASIQAKLADASKTVAVLEFWVEGFGQRGIAVAVLRSVLSDLEVLANKYLSALLEGRVYCQLVMDSDKLDIRLFETVDGKPQERRYEQLSGGQRRCVELAFAPFALSEVVFARCGVRIPLLIIDELTTHLGQEEKPRVCDVLRLLDRETVVVIDHDVTVQSEFDVVFDISKTDQGVVVGRAS